MIFQPQPDNDFPRFTDMYFERCRQQCPKIRAMAAKWSFEDLIPGLSDLDTRFVIDNSATVDDWMHMSIEVGKVHTQLACQFPQWARILEHLPGLNLTLGEITNPLMYYPEFGQWTWYHGDRSILDTIEGYLSARAWSSRDEIFHLKKIATYYGPYQRGIDPPIKIGPWESKYPLHSRFMHYFTPPVQSAVSLVQKRGIRGKREALCLAQKIFPSPGVIDMVLDAHDRHYEIAEYYQEPHLTWIERELESYLKAVWAQLVEHVTLVEVNPGDTSDQIRSKVAAIPLDPVQSFFEGVKFCRFMKGRLLFYAQEIHWFDTAWLIRNELGRIAVLFHDRPLKVYGQVRFGEKLEPAEVLSRLRGNLLLNEECEGFSAFADIAARPVIKGQEKERARQVAHVFDAVLIAIEKLSADLLSLTRSSDG